MTSTIRRITKICLIRLFHLLYLNLCIIEFFFFKILIPTQIYTKQDKNQKTTRYNLGYFGKVNSTKRHMPKIIGDKIDR